MRTLLTMAVAGLLAVPAAADGLKVTPGSLTFSYQTGAVLPVAQSLAVAPASGSTAVTFTVAVSTVQGGNWLTVNPASGKTNATLKATVNPTGLAVGTYTGTIALTPSSGTALSVPVTLQVKAPPATLSATPSQVTLSYTIGSTTVPSGSLSLSSNGALLSYGVTVSGAAWLTAAPKSGIIFPAFTSTVGLAVDPTGLTPGTYKGTVTVASTSAANKSVAVEVALTVTAGPPTLTSLFPPGVTLGSPAITITINGSNFYSGTLVAMDTTPLETVVLGPTAIQARVPASLLAAAGARSVSVTNAGVTGGIASKNFDVYPSGPRITGVTNGASFASGAVAPGEMVSLFGSGLGPESLTVFDSSTSPASLPVAISGVEVTFGTTKAPLVFVSATQVCAMVPVGVAGPKVDIIVSFSGLNSAPFQADVAAAAPGIFTFGSTGSGPAAAFNWNDTTGDISINTEQAPAITGTLVILFATGMGATTPAGTDGLIVRGPTIPAFTAPAATLTIGGQAAVIESFGPAPDLVSGLAQIVARIPATVKANRAASIVLNVGGVDSQAGVTLAVK